MRSPLEHCHQPDHTCHSHPPHTPNPSPLTSCISTIQLLDVSERTLQTAPQGLIITINTTSLSSHRPFFRRPSRLASLIVMTALFFLSYGIDEAQWLFWGHPAGWAPYQKFPHCQRANDVAEQGSIGANKNMSVNSTKDSLIKQQNPFPYQVILVGCATLCQWALQTPQSTTGDSIL